MKSLEVKVLVLNKAEIERLVSYQDVITAVESAYRAYGQGEVEQPQKETMYVDGARRQNLFLAMPAFIKPTNTAGIKWVCVFDHQKPGYPTVSATVVLNDTETGIPIAFLEGSSITNLRTAGHSTVAAKYLAKKNSSTAAFIGCGAEARTHLPALKEIFPLKTVKIYDIKPEAMTTFQKEMSPRFPVEIIPAKSAQEAVEGVDIICLLTTATKPVVLEPWVPKGCFVTGLMGFYDLDPMLSKKADKWVLGHRESDTHLIVDDAVRLGKGLSMRLSQDDVYADMGEIVTGARPGRENDRERIVYTHMGMGIHDLAVAKIAYTRARERGIGIRVKLI